jgi:acyl phosphate:glycerol-3-phosphate acyltransferase
VTVAHGAWVVGAYLIGTFPSAFAVAVVAGARPALDRARAGASQGDAHVLLRDRAGRLWGGLAAALDFLKGLGGVLAARFVADLPAGWLAAVGVALVVGHCFPFYLRPLAGRGLSTGAGVLLGAAPLAMVVAGVLILAGYALRMTGLLSTLGLAAAPLVALAAGEPAAVVAMCAAVLAVILVRRLVGVREAAEESGWPRAVVRRLVFDAERAREPRRPEGPVRP